MKRFEAIATDIDGTLLDSRRELSSKTIETIKRLGPRFPVFLASSRMPSAMRHLQAELDILKHPLICYNGGYSLKYESEKPVVMSSTVIPTAIVSRIVQMGSGTGIHISLYHADDWFAPRHDQWTEREERITKVKATIQNHEATLNQWFQSQYGAHKVMCMGDPEEISWMQRELEQTLGDDVHVYLSRPTYLELAPGSTSKGAALKFLIEKYYDFPMENVLAFGDNYNDIDMLKAVGWGIAVGNSRDEVKTVANEITLPSVEDGVAFAIEKHCFPRENR